MLNKQNTNSSKATWIKYFALIPLLAIAVVFNACTDDNTELPAETKTEKHEMEKLQDAIDQVVISQEKPEVRKVEGTDIYAIAEVMPEYPGGNNAMMTYLGSNIVYPESCKEEGVEGIVFVSFVINEDGLPTELEVLRSPDERLSANALEVVGKMPAWTPGKQDGQPVKVQYNLPISYRLQ